MASNVIGGVLNFRVEGRILATEGQIKIENMGGEMLEPKPQTDGSVKYKRTVKEASLTATISTTPGLNLRQLKDAKFTGVSLQTASGHTYVMRDAVQIGEGAIDAEAGTMELKFAGSKIETI